MIVPILLALTVARGPGAGEVTLAWDGGDGPFAIARAPSAAVVDDPGAHLANVRGGTFVDTPSGPLVYYRVVDATCGNGTLDLGEECDDGGHAGGDGCTPRCLREPDPSCGIVEAPAAATPATGSLWDGIVLFFKLDEAGDGARVDAASGFEIFPDPSGEGTIPVPAKAGGLGQHLDGPNLYHFWSSAAPILDHRPGSFTWAGWVRLDSRYDDQSIVGKWSIPEGQREYLLRYDNATSLFTFDVSFTGGGSTCEVGHVAHPTVVETGRFYLVEGWHDAAAGAIGIRVSTEAMLGPVSTSPWSAGVHFGWGDLNIGAHNTCLDDHLHGTLDAIGFWKRRLTEAESEALWNGGDGVEPTASPAPALR